jgi:predicted short-subunit dehydrogenase-like oxidoreductase (DUF2520 family)
MLGAGNVATHLSRHFYSRGHSISTIYSKTLEHANMLAGEVGARGTNLLEEVPHSADFYLFCLPDSHVRGMAEKLEGRLGICLHTAGALPLQVFDPYHRQCGVLYPLQSLSRRRPLSGDEIPLLIEGSSAEVTGAIRKLATSVSQDIHEMNSASRLVLHLAAVFANNFTNHMVHMAYQILEKEGEDPHLLAPLLRETFRKAEEMGPASAQTGPAARGDEVTMQKHLDLLEAYPELKKMYTFISRDIGRSRKD